MACRLVEPHQRLCWTTQEAQDNGVAPVAAAVPMPPGSDMPPARADNLPCLGWLFQFVCDNGYTSAVVHTKGPPRQTRPRRPPPYLWRSHDGGLAAACFEDPVVADCKMAKREEAGIVATFAPWCSATLANAGTASVPAPAGSNPGAKSALCATSKRVVDLCDGVIRDRAPPHTQMPSVSCCSSRCLFSTLGSC